MVTKTTYEQLILAAYEREKKRMGVEFELGLKQISNLTPLFGYFPPRWMLDFGATCAFLYERKGETKYATLTKTALMFYRDWIKYLPKDAVKQRPEYADGIPPMEPIFHPSIYIPAVLSIRDTLSSSELEILVSILADTLKPIWRFPEWGGHNRAMLRAAGLSLAAKAFPDHADAKQWATLANELAEESWGRWSIEDAMLYQPHWLRALITYARARGREFELEDMIQPRMHLKAITQLISPISILPDFGDSHWLMHSHWEWMACLEWGAGAYRDPSMKWTANRLYDGLKNETPTAYLATVANLAWEWCDESVPDHHPLNHEDALDDLVLKKIVWRTGWEPEATYACLNYRDEGDYGRVARDYLRTTLAVTAEKMHHGHADEGSFAMLIHDGNLLLHESGYREQPPDGVYRSAVYHNRLVWRSGRAHGGEKLLEFLRGDGRYRPVRTERLYQTHLGDSSFHRVRISDENEGLIWDRSIVFIPGLPCWIVMDSVLATRTDFRTISSLWWTTDILSKGDDWFVTHIRGVQEWQNRKDAVLLISIPCVPNQPGNLSIERFRRHFQDEQAIVNTWCGEHRTGHYVNFVSVLWPYPIHEPGDIRPDTISVIGSQPVGRGMGVLLHWDGEERIIGTLNDLSVGFGQADIRPSYSADQGMTEYGEIRSDAALVMVRRNKQGKWAGFINGTFMSCNNEVLYEGLPHAMFQENKLALPGIPARFRWESYPVDCA